MDLINRRRTGALVALISLLAIVALVPIAQAATSSARAGKPSYSSSTLRLSGGGGFKATGKSASVFVTVCLQKRSGGTFIDIRCNSNSSGGRSVSARASVPGCVKGSWRTTSVGYATTRTGSTKLPDYSVSGVFRC